MKINKDYQGSYVIFIGMGLRNCPEKLKALFLINGGPACSFKYILKFSHKSNPSAEIFYSKKVWNVRKGTHIKNKGRAKNKKSKSVPMENEGFHYLRSSFEALSQILSAKFRPYIFAR